MTAGVITLLGDNDKDPGFFGETVFGAGAVSVSDLPVRLLCVGLKRSSAGSMTADVDIVRCYTEDEADTYAGAGGELARMAYAALRLPNVELWLAATANPSGSPVAATATITFAGTWTTTGTYICYVCGDRVEINLAATDTPTTSAAALVTAINAKSRMAVTAANVAGVVTLTAKSVGTRGNDFIAYQDKRYVPSGMTVALAGGASVAGDGFTGDGLRFTGGTGTDDLTNLLDVMKPGRYHRIAFAQRDATNLGRIETYLDFKASPFEGRMEHAIVATNDTQVTATSLAQTTLNYWRTQLLWMLDGETPPPELAGIFGSIRAVTEQTTPNVSYSGRSLPGVAPIRDRRKRPSRSVRVACLNAGVTPINTTDGGEAVIVRSITTRSQTASGDPDYRTLDTSDAVVPDYVRDALYLLWTTNYKVANPYVRPDQQDGEPPIPSGVGTPSSWNAAVEALLIDLQNQLILYDVPNNRPRTVWNATAKRLASIVPVKRLPTQEQMEVSVRQLS